MTQEVRDYEGLDLTPKGELARQLFEWAQTEGQASQVLLSNGGDSWHGNLTGSMRSWYEMSIAPARHAAVDSVDRVMREGDQAAHGDLIFYERDMHTLQRRTASAHAALVASDAADNGAEHARLEKLKEEEAAAARKFKTLKARHDRQPSEWNSKLYLLLLLLIGLAELAINWESFNSIEYFTPAIATGTALVIGFALAASSHFFGMTMRQYRARFNAAADDLDRYSGWKMFGLAALTLTVALGAVGYSRVFYFQQVVMDLMGTGESASMLKVVGGSMISNVLVWIVGVLIAYMAHDPDPNYPQTHSHLQRVRAQREALQKKVERRLGKQREKIDAKHAERTEEYNNRRLTNRGIAQQEDVNELVNRIKAQDARVLALLGHYRQQLVASAAESVVFLQSDATTGTKRALSPAEYNQASLELHYA